MMCPSQEMSTAAVVFPVPAGKESWTVSGRILRRTGPVALPAAGVSVRLRPTPAIRTTGPDGRFEFSGVAAGSFYLEYAGPSSALLGFDLSLDGPTGTPRRDLGDLLLEPGSTLVVRLVGPSGEPIREGRVLVRKDERARAREARSLVDGGYRLDRMQPGTFRVEATAAGHAFDWATVDAPRQEPLAIRLPAERRIAGTVMDRDGKPVEGAEVGAFFDRGTAGPLAPIRTDASGRFMIGRLGEERGSVQVEAGGFAREERWFDVPGKEDLQFILVPEAILEGKVVAAEDGSPIRGARVKLGGSGREQEVESDSQGEFRFDKLRSGSCWFQVEHDDFVHRSFGGRKLTSGDWIKRQIFRLHRGFTVHGVVIDAATKVPVPLAEVRIDERGANNRDRHATLKLTTVDGAFEFSGRSSGTDVYSVRAKGYVAVSDLVREVHRYGELLIVPLERGGSICGRVLDPDGLPASGVLVCPSRRTIDWMDRSVDLMIQTTSTGPEGTFCVEGVPAGEFYLESWSRMYFGPPTESIKLKAGEPVSGVEIRLQRWGTIRGRVLDESGAPVPGATIEHVGLVDYRSDAEGRFVISRVSPVTRSFDVRAKGFLISRRGGLPVVAEGVIEGLDFVLSRGEILSGRVVDAEGQAVAAARIEALTPSGSTGQETLTDADGRFLLSGLERGIFTVQVQKERFLRKELKIPVPSQESRITLDRMAVLRGRVQAQGGEDRRDWTLEISLLGVPGTMETSPVEIGGGGRFEAVLEPGKYLLQASAPGYEPFKSEEMTLQKGELRDGVVIELKK